MKKKFKENTKQAIRSIFIEMQKIIKGKNEKKNYY